MLIAQRMAEKSGTLLLRPSFGHPVVSRFAQLNNLPKFIFEGQIEAFNRLHPLCGHTHYPGQNLLLMTFPSALQRARDHGGDGGVQPDRQLRQQE